MFFFKKEIDKQIKEYIVWKSSVFPSCFLKEEYKELNTFVKFSKIKNIHDIAVKDIEKFKSKIYNTSTPFSVQKAERVIRAFLRFHKIVFSAQTATMRYMKAARLKPGPAPDLIKDEKILAYRMEGLSFSKIADKMNLSVSSVYEKHQRAIRRMEELSTV